MTTTATNRKYEIVIGLEVHAQLKTKTKLFCNCSTAFGEEPNKNTCPVCMGYPGVLPVLNEKAVDFAIQAGLALNCDINRECKFDRKQYFYPDLPKGYQISQWDKPICEHGYLEILGKKVNIVRIHMEEDAGKLVHAGDDADRLHGSSYSLVDLNRAGTPLIEIVSAPDISNADEAVAYVKELRKILIALDVCDGNMQEGSMRCDVNISLNLPGASEYGKRAEIKNVNSFRSIARAIEYEYKRQSKLLDNGEEVTQETRLFEENSGKTFSMRGKEDSHDYRYFPEPDLVPLAISSEKVQEFKNSLPELPQAKQARYISDYKISDEAATVISEERTVADFFEKTLIYNTDPVKTANWVTGALAAHLNETKANLPDLMLNPENFAEMLNLIKEGIISDNIAKNQVFPELLEAGGSAKGIVDKKGLAQITDSSAIEAIVKEVLANNTKQVEQFKSGNQKIKGFFVGQVMKQTQGKASPAIINQAIDKQLAEVTA
jgi:aspartyl-tRNA(Asn)/glutamyl-tRNA(Gln) amidotransferase subunit B